MAAATFQVRLMDDPQIRLPGENRWLFEQNFAAKEDFRPVSNLCKNSTQVTPFWAVLITVRTGRDNLGSLKPFCRDFFLPTFFNVAMKLNRLEILKVIAAPFAILIDLLTLAFRVITLIPRIIYNQGHTREAHPLHQYLKEQNADPWLFDADLLVVKRTYIEGGKVLMREEILNLVEMPQFDIPVDGMYDLDFGVGLN